MTIKEIFIVAMKDVIKDRFVWFCIGATFAFSLVLIVRGPA